MFAKLVLIEESDLEYHINLNSFHVGMFGVFYQSQLTPCETLTCAKVMIDRLEGNVSYG